MAEVLAAYRNLGAVSIGLLLFPLGLIVGSFCSVLIHRVPLKQSIVWGRSECPHCRHVLGARDLLPVLSFLLQRGKCRHCARPISHRYLMLELASGLLASLAGVAGGWTAGLVSMTVWVALVSLFSAWRLRSAQSGLSMVETLVALSILTAVMIPMLNLRFALGGRQTAARQLAMTLAARRLEDLGREAYTGYNMPGGGSANSIEVYPYRFRQVWMVSVVENVPSERLQQAVVVVTCTNCGRYPMAPVRLTSYLVRLDY